MADSDTISTHPRRGRPRSADDDNSAPMDTKKRRIYERGYRQKKKTETALFEQKYETLLEYFNSTRDLICVQNCSCHARLAAAVQQTSTNLDALSNDTMSQSDSDVKRLTATAVTTCGLKPRVVLSDWSCALCSQYH